MFTLEGAGCGVARCWSRAGGPRMVRRALSSVPPWRPGRRHHHHLLSRHATVRSALPRPRHLASSSPSPHKSYSYESAAPVFPSVDACLREAGLYAAAATNLPPSVANLLLADLAHHHYAALCREIPWLETKKITALLQLNISERLEGCMAPILNHPGFLYLQENVRDNIGYYSPQEKVDVYNNLVLLSVSNESPVMHRVFSHILACVPEMDMTGLAGLALILGRLPRGARIISMNRYITRFSQLYRHLDNVESCSEIAYVVNYNAVSMSHELTCDVAVFLLDAITQMKDDITDPACVCALASAGRKLSRDIDTDMRAYPEKLTLAAREVGLRLLHTFEPVHIADFCRQLKIFQLLSADVSARIQDRCLELLDRGGLRLPDLANLMHGLSKKASTEDRRRFENALYQQMGDVDLVMLSHLSESFYSSKMENCDIIRRFETLLLQHSRKIHLISPHNRLRSLMKFLASSRHQNPSFNALLRQDLIDCLMCNGLPWTIAWPGVLSFLFCLTDTALPAPLFSKILSAVPTFNIPYLMRVLIDLKDAGRTRNDLALQRQINKLEYEIMQRLVEVKEQVKHVHMLNQLIQTVMSNRNFKDMTLIEQLVSMYPKFTANLCGHNEHTVCTVAHTLLTLRFYLPTVYDDMVRFILSEPDRIALTTFSLIISCCSTVWYTPKHFDVFIQKFFDKCDAERPKPQSKVVLFELRCLRGLAISVTHPETVLSRVFTFEYLQQVDLFIDSYPGHQQEVEGLMMDLNRSIVLECPQLEVPWFHDSFTVSSYGMSSYGRMLREEVQPHLEEVLGGCDYYRSSTVSPYHYMIDFELILYEGHPLLLPSRLTPDTYKKLNCQRVAVLLLKDTNYCFNSHRLVGWQRMKKRHLEILGYKVVQVPNFEWYSMGLADEQAKQEYLRNKIFS